MMKLKLMAKLCNAFAVLLGIITIFGWLTGRHLLASISAGYIPMAPLTALLFVCLGFVSFLYQWKPGSRASKCVGSMLSAVVTAVVVVKLVEFQTGRGLLRLEEALTQNPGRFGEVLLGRMSPTTAVGFALDGVALSLLWLNDKRRMVSTAAGLASLVVLESIVVILGYLYQAPLLYGGRVIPMALTTALAFLFLGVGIISAIGSDFFPLRPFMGDSARALMLRAFLPLLVAAVLADGAIRNFILNHFAVNTVFLSAISAVSFAALISILVSQVSRIVGGRIDCAEAEREKARDELRVLNAALEQRVEERTCQLRERTKQMEEDLRMAREMQLAMLPQSYPPVPRAVAPSESALQFLTFYWPTGAVSGDYFNVVRISDTAVGVFICDVMGHGVRAALVTAMMHAFGEELRSLASDPGKLLTHINCSLVGILQQTGTTMFATAFYVVADVAEREFRYANAGHPNPLRLQRKAGVAEPLQCATGAAGPALGLFAESTYTTNRCPLAAADVLVLFTDGLFEVDNAAGDQYGPGRMLEFVRARLQLPLDEIFERLVLDIQKFAGNQGFGDDVCLVGMEVTRIVPPEGDST
jgi:serine phosphatase RsbU (regulator of sigma subunit)